MQYSIERVGTPERWARVQAKMDTLTPRRRQRALLGAERRPALPVRQGPGRRSQRHGPRRRRQRQRCGSPGARQPMRTLSRDIAPLAATGRRCASSSASTPRRIAHTLRAFVIALALAVADAPCSLVMVARLLDRARRPAAAEAPVDRGARAAAEARMRSGCRCRACRSSSPTSPSPSTARSTGSRTPTASSRPSTPTSRTSCARRSPT